MLFCGKDGQQVELRILGYQFPSDTIGNWDSNWLRIYVRVISKKGNWQTIDSCLTTWEVRELIQWFRDLSTNTSVDYPSQVFTEPNLQFDVLTMNDHVTMRLRFYAELRPQSSTNDDDYFVDFEFSKGELHKIVDELQAEYDKFPERSPSL